MSEVERTYSGPKRGLSRSRSRGHRSGGFRIVAALMVIFVAMVFWSIRDTHSMDAFISGEARVEIYATDVLTRRLKIADSHIWSVLGEDDSLANLPEVLRGDLDLPGWVLPNVIGPECHISGNDAQSFSDAVLVTRMTPVGTLLLHVDRMLPGIAKDNAGGLNVRVLEDPELYYAVRGRVLIISNSRRALIKALTLGAEERASTESIARAFAEAAASDLSGRFELLPDEPLGELFTSVSFALRLDSAEGLVKFRATFTPQWKERLALLTARAQPQPLLEPIPGPAQISADFGLSTRDLWAALGAAFENDTLSAETWEAWQEDDGSHSPTSVFSTLLGMTGPSIQLTWQGVDLNEIIPAPRLAGMVEAEHSVLSARMEQLPSQPLGPAFRDPYVYYDRDTRTLRAVTIGGPSLHPLMAWNGDWLLVSSSSEDADTLLASTARPSYLPEPANLYISVKPGPCIDMVASVGNLLAEDGLLRDHTPESFDELTNTWRARTGSINEVRLVLTIDKDTVEGELSAHFYEYDDL